MQPKISVLVPFYNCEKYIAECIDSIQRDMPNRAVEIGRHFGGQRQFHQHRIGTSRNNPLVAPTHAVAIRDRV